MANSSRGEIASFTVQIGRLYDAQSEPAQYEFYNVFPADTLKAGNSYDVTIQAYDRNNAAIEGAACEISVSEIRTK